MLADAEIYQLNGNIYRKMNGDVLQSLKEDQWTLLDEQLRYMKIENQLYIHIQLFHDQYVVVAPCTQEPTIQSYATCSALYRQEIESLTQQQQAWYQGIRTLNQSLERKALLTTLIDNVMLAMPAVDRGFFTLFDEEQQLLVPVASSGLQPSIYMFKTKIGEGIAGKVFEMRQARAYTKDEAFEAMQDLTPENEHHLMVAVNSTEEELRQQISMAAPVAIGDKCYGVLVLHQYTSIVHHNDMHLLQAFADQAAVAIHNAELYEEMQRANENLMKQQQIHTLFTNLALENSSMAQIVQTAEQLIQRTCYFIDAYEFQLTPMNEQVQQFFKTMTVAQWSKKEPHLLKDAPYYLHPVLNGQVIVGYFIVESTNMLDQMAVVVVEQASVIIALKLSNRRALEESIHLQRKERMQQLLLQKKPVRLQKLCKEAGLMDAPFVVCMAHFYMRDEERLFFDLQTTQFLAQLEPSAFHYKDRDRIIFIVQQDIPQMIERFKTVTEHWNDTNIHQLAVAISAQKDTMMQLAQAYEEAESTLDYLQKRGEHKLMQYDDLGINRLFLNHDTEAISQFTAHTLAPLQQPRAVASQLEETLMQYIQHNRSISKTAQALHIHQNTLYHRLEKIEGLLHVNLNDWNDFLTITLALRLKQ